LLHLFYTNAKTIMHNKNVFQKTLTQTFTFLIGNVHSQTCPCHFKMIKYIISNNLFALRNFRQEKNVIGIVCKEL
jgi:hypothetical protein